MLVPHEGGDDVLAEGALQLRLVPEAGPKRRHHSTRYAVREMIPSNERSGILALTSCFLAPPDELTSAVAAV